MSPRNSSRAAYQRCRCDPHIWSAPAAARLHDPAEQDPNEGSGFTFGEAANCSAVRLVCRHWV
jgi:hypothetical protein